MYCRNATYACTEVTDAAEGNSKQEGPMRTITNHVLPIIVAATTSGLFFTVTLI